MSLYYSKQKQDEGNKERLTSQSQEKGDQGIIQVKSLGMARFTILSPESYLDDVVFAYINFFNHCLQAQLPSGCEDAPAFYLN